MKNQLKELSDALKSERKGSLLWVSNLILTPVALRESASKDLSSSAIRLSRRRQRMASKKKPPKSKFSDDHGFLSNLASVTKYADTNKQDLSMHFQHVFLLISPDPSY